MATPDLPTPGRLSRPVSGLVTGLAPGPQPAPATGGGAIHAHPAPGRPTPGRPVPNLAAVLIARNEERCIARCLDSLRPWVGRMVVLDTGSTDATVARARQAGAEVHAMAWADDFSAARNRALDLADADWALILDADEWILSGAEALHDWCAGPARLGTVMIDSQFDAPDAVGGTRVQQNRITRLVPRGVRYRGRVHEQLVSALPRAPLPLHLGHDGYRDAQMAGKRDRNRPLLLRDLQDRPGDPYILYQLGRDAESRADHAQACAHYAPAFAATPATATWRHDLLVRYLHCLGQAGRLDEACALADPQLAQWPDSPDLFFVIGNLALDQALRHPDQALGQWLPLAEQAWQRCLAIGDRPDLEGSVHGRGNHLARHNLAVLRAQTGLLRA